MDRYHDLESLRRSIAMLVPRAWAMRREEAMALIRELQDHKARLARLCDGLTKLLEQDAEVL